ncbi:MAG: efflux RND transporter permease subunit, partial [Terriglobales bacterium]
MIHRLVQLALRQRFMVVLIALLVAAGGIVSFHDMPLAAYPDLSPPMVEVITQWPGHAAEEVERLVTLPIELAFNATPHLVYMRSISLYGLSDVTLTFKDGTDIYWARNLVYRRMMQASLPAGVTPSMSPDSSPSDLIYRYVVESPDRTPQELKTIEDWVLERDYKSIPGVADDSGFGGTVMQYQVLL